MLCAPGRQTAFILDVDTMTETPLSLPEGSVLTLPPFTLSDSAPFEFTPDGMKVVAMCSGPSDFRGLRVFSAQNGKHEVEIAGDMPAMLEIAACLSPDGSSVLLARDGACRLFDLTDGGLLVTYAADRASWAPFSPEGNRVLLWKSEASCVFDTKTGAERLRIPTHALGFSPDGKKLVRMGEAWDATDGRPLAQDPSRARGLPAGERTLVYDTGAEPARIVDVSTGRTLFTWTRSGHRVLDGTFSPDGQLLLSYAFLNPTGGLDYSETNFREVVLWARRRPEYWWGLAWLPEFWLVYFSSGALLIIAARNLRQRWAAKSETA
jgi:WD40 repeat protein